MYIPKSDPSNLKIYLGQGHSSVNDGYGRVKPRTELFPRFSNEQEKVTSSPTLAVTFLGAVVNFGLVVRAGAETVVKVKQVDN